MIDFRKIKGGTYIPQLLVSGVDVHGKRHDLFGFGEWMDTQSKDAQKRIIRTDMNEADCRSFWSWSNRKGPPPKSLKVALAKNPEFVEWIDMSRGHDVACAKINRDHKTVEAALLRAFRNGQILTRGIKAPKKQHPGGMVSQTMHSIQLKTADFVKWLKMEFEIEMTVNAVACWPDDPLLLDILESKE